MSENSTRTNDGVPIVKMTPKPYGTTTVFMGSCDCPTNGFGAGDALSFDLTDQDAAISVVLSFSELVYIKDCIIYRESAPFGSKVTVVVEDTSQNLVANVIKNAPLWGSGRLDLNSEDAMAMTPSYQLKVTVSNATTKVAFKATGILEIYRESVL